MQKVPTKKRLWTVLTLNKEIKLKRAIVFERLTWPKEVWILEPKFISEEVTGSYDDPQCLWGHVNNELRRHLEVPLRDAQSIIYLWLRHQSYVNHILVSKFAHKTFFRNRRDAITYNAAWATLGYVTEQEPFVLELAQATLPSLIKNSPGSVPL